MQQFDTPTLIVVTSAEITEQVTVARMIPVAASMNGMRIIGQTKVEYDSVEETRRFRYHEIGLVLPYFAALDRMDRSIKERDEQLRLEIAREKAREIDSMAAFTCEQDEQIGVIFGDGKGRMINDLYSIAPVAPNEFEIIYAGTLEDPDFVIDTMAAELSSKKIDFDFGIVSKLIFLASSFQNVDFFKLARDPRHLKPFGWT